MIDTIVEKIEEEFDGMLITQRPLQAMPKDIDIYIPKQKVESLHSYLLKEGFTCQLNTHKLQALKFFEGELFFLDIAFDLNYLIALFPTFTLLPAFVDAVRQDPNVERFYKYIFSFRTDEIGTKFIEENYEKYQSVFFDSKYINKPIFRTNLSRSTLIGITHKNLFALLSGFTLEALSVFFLSKIFFQFSRLGKGKIIAVIGPDGSGKSTVIAKLKIALFAKTIYMGDWGFVLQPFYNQMHKQHIAIARLTYVLFYIENWLRYIRAWWYKMNGLVVLVDRYPGLNRHLRKNDIWLRINDFIYIFFPKADKYLFISLPPELVHQRRQELTVEEIQNIQENIRLRLKHLDFLEVENINLDACLNQALSYITFSKRS